MSIFSEILCYQFPDISLPSINSYHISKLNNSKQIDQTEAVGIQFVYNIYYLNLDNKKKKSNKFIVLDDTILSNNNLNDNLINYYFINFCYSQKIYNSLRRFVRKLKFKFGKRFEVSADLCLNPFSQLKKHMLISLIEKNIVYKFRISDIMNIINKSLTNSVNFFADPLSIKNPYTNLPFTICNLYNIYFFIKNSNYNMPILFHQFFMSNFNLIIFQNTNECLIRDAAINNFVRESTNEEKYEYINKMLYAHYDQIMFEIDPLFPKKKLIETFERYIRTFLLQEYSLNPFIRDTSRIKLEYRLSLFSQLNPNFGRRINSTRRRRDGNNSYTLRFDDSVDEASNINFNYTYNYNSLITSNL